MYIQHRYGKRNILTIFKRISFDTIASFRHHPDAKTYCQITFFVRYLLYEVFKISDVIRFLFHRILCNRAKFPPYGYRYNSKSF